ncbi:MAG: hypothetical protein R3B91_16360 [Planctomycetaceae bacterium]
MDPDTTLQGLLDAARSARLGPRRRTEPSLTRLFKQGGFPPLTLGPRELGKQWHHTVTYFTCYAAIARSREAANDADVGRSDRKEEDASHQTRLVHQSG